MNVYCPWNIAQSMDEALVSVITPTYNRVDILLQAIKCVQKQSYRPIEHIIIGDHCPQLEDRKEELLKMNPKLLVINLGADKTRSYGPERIARVRNAGINVAHGTLLAHLDDDNLWEHNHVESLVNTLRQNPKSAVALSQRLLLLDGTEPYVYPCHPWSPSIEEGKKVWDAYSRMGVYKLGSPIMADRISFLEERDITADTNEMLVRREVHQVFPFLERFPETFREADLGEDDVFCMQLYEAGMRMAASGLPTLRFRLGGRFTETVINSFRAEMQRVNDECEV